MAKSATQSAITKVKVKGTLQLIIGWILAILFGIPAIVGTTQIREVFDVVMVISFIAITVGGILLIISGKKKMQLIIDYRNYSSCLDTDATKSIALLAASVGVPIATATKNIADMIQNGFFPNAYIDTVRNCIVFTDFQYPSQNNQPPVNNSVSYITVQCKGCGATNKIPSGTVGECEFCGSQISENQGER